MNKFLSFTFSSVWMSLGILAQAGTELPHGCGTFVICESKMDSNDEPDGAQVCKNADNKKTVVIQAFWKKNQLEGDFFCANDDGVPKVKAHYKGGKLDGRYQEYNADLKQWALDEVYQGGKKEGISKRLLPNGNTVVKWFKSDQQHGFELMVDGSGRVVARRNCHISEQRHEDNACEGIAIPGYESAMAHQEAQAQKQKAADDNRVVETKYTNGKTMERYKLVGGKANGLYEKFFNTGILREKYTAVDGKHDGVYEGYFENGVLETKAIYRRGEKLERSTFFRDGQIESHTLFKNDLPYQVTQYYQNGKVSSEGVETDIPGDRLRGRVRYKNFHDNGQLAESGTLLRTRTSEWGYGRYDGERQLRSKGGETSEVEYYEDGKEVGTWKVSGPRYETETEYRNGVRLSETVYEKKTRKQFKRVEFMPDGSTRSETVDPM